MGYDLHGFRKQEAFVVNGIALQSSLGLLHSFLRPCALWQGESGRDLIVAG